MQARSFNEIQINFDRRILTKSSTNIEKIKDEVHYYLNLPKEVADFFPKLLDYNENLSAYTMEYFPYNSLSDLILQNKITKWEGKDIINHLLNILDRIHLISPKKNYSKSEIYNFYINKTKQHVKSLEKNVFFKKLLSSPIIKINGFEYKNFYHLEKNYCDLFKRKIDKNHKITAIHGDFSFSNILYSPTKKIVKLVDPRGSFTSRGIFGHSLYDYAKLMHCLHMRYDYIVNNQFRLDEYKNKYFYIQILDSSLMDSLEKSCIKKLQERSIDIEFIHLIEVSLFLSMANLYNENLNIQKTFYLKGIMLLNHIVQENLENMH